MLGFLLDVKFRCEQMSHLPPSQISGISFGYGFLLLPGTVTLLLCGAGQLWLS